MKHELKAEYVNSILELKEGELYWKKQLSLRSPVGSKAGFIGHNGEREVIRKVSINKHKYSSKYIIHLIINGDTSFKVEYNDSIKLKALREDRICLCGCGQVIKNILKSDNQKYFNRQHSDIHRKAINTVRRLCGCGCKESLIGRPSSTRYVNKEHKKKHRDSLYGRTYKEKGIQSVTHCILCLNQCKKDSLFCGIIHEKKFNQLKSIGENIPVIINDKTTLLTHKYDNILTLRDRFINKEFYMLRDVLKHRPTDKFTQEELSLELLEESFN